MTLMKGGLHLKRCTDLKKISKEISNRNDDIKRAKYEEKEWYTIRAILGNWWANWFVLGGARERGKTFTVQDYVLGCWANPNHPLYHVPFYWMRLNDAAVQRMLMNNGAKMFEPLLVDRYNLDIKVKGDTVFLGEDKLCYVFGLSTAYNNKGGALFNKKTFKGANIIVDEVALEKGQRKTFDVCYNLKMQIENICRSERNNVKVFFMLNNTEDCPEIMTMFNFIPLEFGVYKLKRKHCVIDYIPNNEAYEKRRKTALANEIDNGTGNFTNKVSRDIQLIDKSRKMKPTNIIKFTNDESDWFTVWDNKIIAPYSGQKVEGIAMKRGVNDIFNPELRDAVLDMFDARYYHYDSYLTQERFKISLEHLRR